MSTNDVTGDRLISKANTENYRSNWDLIFGKNQIGLATFAKQLELNKDPVEFHLQLDGVLELRSVEVKHILTLNLTYSVVEQGELIPVFKLKR